MFFFLFIGVVSKMIATVNVVTEKNAGARIDRELFYFFFFALEVFFSMDKHM